MVSNKKGSKLKVLRIEKWARGFIRGVKWVLQDIKRCKMVLGTPQPFGESEMYATMVWIA